MCVEEGNIYGSVVLCLKAFFSQLFPDVFRAPLNYICMLQMFVLILDAVRLAIVTVIFNLSIVFLISHTTNERLYKVVSY